MTQSENSAGLRCGWAREEITPELPARLCGQFYERMSTSVRDPLYATALAIESAAGNPHEHVIIVSCDLIGIQTHVLEAVRERLRTILPDFDPLRLIIAATHIHTGPYTAANLAILPGEPSEEHVAEAQRYAARFVDAVCCVAVRAWQSRACSFVAPALGRAVVGHNRRVCYHDGSAIMYGETDVAAFRGLEGASDSGVELLYVFDSTGALSGVVVAIACPAQVMEHTSEISADVWGAVREVAARELGTSVCILPLLASAGDQSPRDLVRRAPNEPDMYSETGLREVAGRITSAILSQAGAARERMRSDIIVRHTFERIELPLRTVTAQQVHQAAAELAARKEKPAEKAESIESQHAGIEEFFAQGIVARAALQERVRTFTAELHALRIGETVIVTNPFELFLEYGFRIKACAPSACTMCIQLACGEGGYLPTARAVSGGGYSAEVANGFVGPEGGDALVGKSLYMIRQLWEDSV